MQRAKPPLAHRFSATAPHVELRAPPLPVRGLPVTIPLARSVSLGTSSGYRYSSAEGDRNTDANAPADSERMRRRIERRRLSAMPELPRWGVADPAEAGMDEEGDEEEDEEVECDEEGEGGDEGEGASFSSHESVATDLESPQGGEGMSTDAETDTDEQDAESHDTDLEEEVEPKAAPAGHSTSLHTADTDAEYASEYHTANSTPPSPQQTPVPQAVTPAFLVAASSTPSAMQAYAAAMQASHSAGSSATPRAAPAPVPAFLSSPPTLRRGKGKARPPSVAAEGDWAWEARRRTADAGRTPVAERSAFAFSSVGARRTTQRPPLPPQHRVQPPSPARTPAPRG